MTKSTLCILGTPGISQGEEYWITIELVRLAPLLLLSTVTKPDAAYFLTMATVAEKKVASSLVIKY